MEKYNNYIAAYKNYKKFEEEGKLIWCRYYLDDYQFNQRVDFVLELIRNYVKEEFVMEVQFWEKNELISDFFKNIKNSCSIIKKYRNKQDPGVIISEDYCLDMDFFQQLLQNHYNYELAYEPSLSVKILLFIDKKDYLMVFDFYDDRGFIINYYYK